MLVCVPDPVCQIERGNSSSYRPAARASAASTIARAQSSDSRPRERLARAAAAFWWPKAWMTSQGIFGPSGKSRRARAVCGPHRRSAGTISDPATSASSRVAASSTISAPRAVGPPSPALGRDSGLDRSTPQASGGLGALQPRERPLGHRRDCDRPPAPSGIRHRRSRAPPPDRYGAPGPSLPLPRR